MRNIFSKAALATCIAVGMGAISVQAQAPAENNPAPKPQPWSANCVSEGRSGELECIMQQRVVMTNTGQLLAAMTVRIPNKTRKPIMAIQVPFGISLGDGLKLAVGDSTLETVAFRTCDAGGCYAEGALQDKTLASLRKAETVNVVVKDLAGREIKVPVALDGFAAAYDKIR